MSKIGRIVFHAVSLMIILVLINFNIYIFLDAAGRLQVMQLNAGAEISVEESSGEELYVQVVEEYDALGQPLGGKVSVFVNDHPSPAPQEESGGTKDKESSLEFGSAADEIMRSGAAYQIKTGVVAAMPDAEGAMRPEPQIMVGTYRVAQGDNLSWIADKYDTTTSRLKELNKLATETIRANQILIVPINTAKDYPAGITVSEKEVKWIAQMIHAEARGEPYLGQVAVGAVIINRVKSSKFPNTVYDVLFQDNAFQPIRNGSFYAAPSEQAYRAAFEALNGNDPTNGALYFFNPKISSSQFMHTRAVSVTIGQHRFAY